MGPSQSNGVGIGRVNTMAFHPTNPDIFWVGTSAGGIWKTTSGGTSWLPQGDNLASMGVSSIVVDPNNGDNLYIATGDKEPIFYISWGNTLGRGDTKFHGVYHSTDGGTTWTQQFAAHPGHPNDFLVHKLLMHPTNPLIQYAATSDGLFKTTNGWATLPAGPSAAGWFIDIEFCPGSTDTIYASTFSQGGGAQVIRSLNGSNFSQIFVSDSLDRIEINVSIQRRNEFDFVGSNQRTGGMDSLFFSIDYGNVIGRYAMANFLGPKDDGTSAGGDAWAYLSFSRDPFDFNNYFIGSRNTWRSTDWSSNYSISNVFTSNPLYNTTSNPNIVQGGKTGCYFHPLVQNTVFETNKGGIWKSTDLGVTWNSVTDGLKIGQCNSISCSQLDPDLVFVGTEGGGSFALTGNSQLDFTDVIGCIVQLDNVDTSYFYTCFETGKIVRWHNRQPDGLISLNLPGGLKTGQWITPYMIDPVTSTTLYAGYEELYKSTDRGDTWTAISNFQGALGNILYLDVSPVDPNYIYVGTFDKVYGTTNGGTSWTDRTGALPVSIVNISSLTVTPFDAQEVIVTFSGFDAGIKIASTVDAGATWAVINAPGLPNVPVNCVEIDRHSGDTYAGTDGGVYLFDGSNGTWVPYGTGLPNVMVNDLDIQYSTGKLRVGTYGRGVWETDVLTPFVGIAEPLADFQLYPNPNNGSFTIQAGENAQLNAIQILDGLGQVVYESAGSDLSGIIQDTKLAAGVYIVRAQLADQFLTRKIVVQ